MILPLGSIIFASSEHFIVLSFGLAVLLALAFWVWMIVDCAKHEADSTTKIVWLLIILFAGVIGAPLYFLVCKLPRRSTAILHWGPLHQPWQKDQRLS